nr:2211_t:CDS:2 [Entrophospora candida]
MGRKQKNANKILTTYPIPSDSQKIVRILNNRGKNLFEIEYPDGTTTLSILPSKFRNIVWVKRGGYVIMSPVESDNKIGGEIIHVLLPEHVKNLKSEGIWPKEFKNKDEPLIANNDGDNDRLSRDDDSDNDIFVNLNHINIEEESDDENPIYSSLNI